MIKVRKSEERGHANHGWLDSYHTFSFADYYDPQNMGFRYLRVINQDRIEGGTGFGSHPHHNMEIITYILEGALEHKDSMGTGSIIVSGDVQRMSAGTGVTHSEYNHLKSQPTRLLQIWFLPEKQGITPEYEQKNFSAEEKQGKLILVGSRDGRDGSITIHQDVDLYAALLDKDQEVEYKFNSERNVWIQVARGSVKLNNEYELEEGDGVAITQENELKLTGMDNAEVLLFDLG